MGVDNNNTVSITIQVVDANSQQVLQGVETKLLAVGTAGAAAGRQISGFGGALQTAGAPLAKFEGGSVSAGSAAGKMASSFGLAGANLSVFGTSLQSTAQGLTGFSNAAIKTGNDVDEVVKKTEKASGSMRMVGGSARELGLNLGYSMRHAIAESEAMMTTLKAAEGLFIAMAAIEIGKQIFEGLQEVWEKWFDINAALDEYREKAAGAANQKLFETASIETTISLLHQVTDEIDNLEAKRVNAGNLVPFAAPVGSIKQALGYHSDTYTTGDSAKEVQDLEAQGTLQARLREQQHAAAIQQIEDQDRAKTAALGAWDKITAAQQLSNDKARENFSYAQQSQQALQAFAEKRHQLEEEQVKAGRMSPDKVTPVPQIDQNAGWKDLIQQQTAAAKAASAEKIALSRQESEQVIQMQNAAVDAGVRGEARYDEVRQQAIDAVKRRREEGAISEQTKMAETAALDMKFHNEKMQRIDDENHATLKLQQQAQGAGLTGIPKIEQERQSSQSEIEYQANQGAFADPATAGARRAAVDQQTNAQITQARQQFNEKIQQMDDALNAQMTNGYARIAAQEKQSLAERSKAYQEFYGDQKVDQTTGLSNWTGYQDDVARIEQNSDREREQYSRQVNEQITQTEAQAARLVLPPWQAAQQQIADEYTQRLQKIHADVDQHVVTEQQGAQQVQAAWDLASAQMAKAAQQSRDQIAGQLEQLFSDPAKYMQNRAKQVMTEILANWVEQLMKAQPQFGGIMGGLLGMNPVGTGQPGHPMAGIFENWTGKAGGHQESLGMPTGELSNASTTLISAGGTLANSGTMLMDAATQISIAMQQWGAMSGGGGGAAFSNPLASGGFGGLGGSGGGWTGIGSSPSMGMPSMWSGDAGGGAGGGAPNFAGSTGAAQSAMSVGSGTASMIPGAGGAIEQGLQLTSMMRGAFGNTGGTAPLLNPSGGFQPTDIAPTNDAGVPGTVPNSAPEGAGGMNALSMGAGLVSGGMGLFGAFEQGFHSSTFAGGLMSMASGAMSGAAIGSMFMPGIGTAIGAAAGAMVGLLGDLFGDHGRGKAVKYNTDTVLPGIQKDMDDFSFGGGGYDQATMALTSLQMQALQQTKQWGSGAVDYYQSTIIPEIVAAQQQVDREGAAGRSNVKMSAAQFHAGGRINDFGDLWTSPTTGFIHAELGEHVVRGMAAAGNGSTLDAMNAGTLSMRSPMPLGGGGGDTHHHHHYQINALDMKSFDAALRNGYGAAIQTHLNQNAGRYAGKAVNAG